MRPAARDAISFSQADCGRDVTVSRFVLGSPNSAINALWEESAPAIVVASPISSGVDERSEFGQMACGDEAYTDRSSQAADFVRQTQQALTTLSIELEYQI